MDRDRNLKRIQQLDPIRDRCQIYHLMIGYEFSWDIRRSLEIALFRTFCVPSISALLDKTGEFHHRPQKRYDDTTLIINKIAEWGYDSERGRAAIDRMNRIHGNFNIANEDFLYVLSLFVYEPIRWNARFGWRPMCANERLASFYFWQALGERMHIQNIPETYEAFERYNLDYERQNIGYSETNRRIGESTRNLFLSWFPPYLRPILEPSFYALMDENMLDAFGFPHPPKVVGQMVSRLLKLRGQMARLFPPRQRSSFQTSAPPRSYPNGYTLEDLGPSAQKDSESTSEEIHA